MAYSRNKRPMTDGERAEWMARKTAAVTRWKVAREYAAANAENETAGVAAACVAAGKMISITSYCFVLLQMADLKLKGTPYVDVKTFEGWKQVGRSVRSGEKSRICSIVWVGGNNGQDEPADGDTAEGSRRLWPKMSALFHIDQTEERQQEEQAEREAA